MCKICSQRYAFPYMEIYIHGFDSWFNINFRDENINKVAVNTAY